ncbi:hypothetical protein V5E38_14430 [Rossellomorea sp. GAMAL-10_SWC]
MLLLFDTGQVWNAFATLRSVIENELRKFAIEKNLDINLSVSVGKVLNQLGDKGVINEKGSSNLKYIISICNKAVHGMDVELGIAKRMVYIAFDVLNEMKQDNFFGS